MECYATFRPLDMHIYTEKALTSVCLSFYNAEKISEAKELLFSTTKEEVTRRRGDGKTMADIGDILALLRKLDEGNVHLPTFVADSCRSMPPSSGFEVLAEHMVTFISEIALLKEEIRDLRAAKTSDGKFIEIKEELRDIKLSLERQILQTAICPHTEAPRPYSECVELPKRDETPILPVIANKNNLGTTGAVTGRGTRVETPMSGPASSGGLQREKDEGRSEGSHSRQPSPGKRPSQQWQLVQTKRKRETIKGMRKVAGEFKGAKRTAALYIGRCDPSVTPDVLKNYIDTEFKIPIISCTQISNENSEVKSFKVLVGADVLSDLLGPSMWPENIVVRKFFFNRNHGRNSN